jgi:hypothetical protein
VQEITPKQVQAIAQLPKEADKTNEHGVGAEIKKE